MGRIRTIKPEFPQSETIGRLSRDARLCFIQLWTIVDDSGRTRAASRMLASLLYPYDDDAVAEIPAWLDELEKACCIERYEVAGSQYLKVCKWLDHQKIDKPSASKFPDSPKAREGSETPRAVPVPVPRNVSGSEPQANEHPIRPEMIARGVLVELCLSGRDLAVVIEEVCRSELARGALPGDIRDGMTAAWRDYEANKPNLTFTRGAARFFGEGDWRKRDGWPWRENGTNKRNAETKYEQAAREAAESDRPTSDYAGRIARGR